MKRFFDFVASAIGLIILLPFFIVIAILIVLNSKGPVFYMQERVGKDSLPFRLFKFRTMYIDADRGHAITVGGNDPRITNMGLFLRKYKIDEFPQLINVLGGDMSLVGPRPEVSRFTKLYSEEQRTVLRVLPGITDLASIQFRNENQLLEGKEDPINYYVEHIMPEKLRLNMIYIQRQSFWLDLKILFRTVWLIVRR